MDRIDYKYKIPCVSINSSIGLFLDNNLYKYLQTESGNRLITDIYPPTNINYELALVDTDLYIGYFYTDTQLKLSKSQDDDNYIVVSDQYLSNEELISINTQLKTQLDSANQNLEEVESELDELQKQYQLLESKLEQYKGFEKINEVKASCPYNIFVDIFRISADGEYLELDVSCHPDYMFTDFIIADYEHNEDNKKIWDFSEDIDEESNRQMFRIKLSELNGPSMYYANISVILRNSEENDYINVIDSKESTMMVCSDVTNVYYYLLKELQSVANPCDPCNSKLSTELQRVFVILYAHLEAMRLERWTEAEMFYTLIKNNFSNCKSSYELGPSKSCNCYGKIR